MRTFRFLALWLLLAIHGQAAFTQLNVLSGFGVSTNSSDNYVGLESAMAAAASLRTALYIPSGIYKTRPLTAPPGYFEIVGDNVAGIKYPAQAGTRLVQVAVTTGPLLHIPTLSSPFITGIMLDGNGTNQTAATPLVLIDPSTIVGNARNEMAFFDCSFVNSKGPGLFINAREEVIMNWCTVSLNGSHGIVISNVVDQIAEHLLIGFNGGDGWHSESSSSSRIGSIDSYFNRGHGMFIKGPVGGVRIYGGTINNNFKDSIHLEGIASLIEMTGMNVFGANWDSDGQGNSNPAANYTYDDVSIGDSIYTTGLVFKGFFGIVQGAAATKFPAYTFRSFSTSTNYPAGRGVTIDGVVAHSDGAHSLGTFFPSTFTDNAILPAAVDANGLGYASRIGGGKVSLTGPLHMDGNGTLNIYQFQQGGFGVEMAGAAGTSKFFLVDTNGLMSIPGGLTTLGPLTNQGNINMTGLLDMLLPAASTNVARVYPTGDGSVGLSSGAGSASPGFAVLHTNGVFEVSGPVTATSGNSTNSGSLIFNSQGVNAKLYQHQAGGLALEVVNGGITNYYTFGANGTLVVPGAIVTPLFQAAELDTSTLITTNGVSWLSTNSVPSNTNAVLWVPIKINGVSYSLPVGKP